MRLEQGTKGGETEKSTFDEKMREFFRGPQSAVMKVPGKKRFALVVTELYTD